MQGSDGGELLKQRHNARKTRGMLGAEKINPRPTGMLTNEGRRGTGRLSQEGSYTICLKSLENVSARDPAVPLLGISPGKITRDRSQLQNNKMICKQV